MVRFAIDGKMRVPGDEADPELEIPWR